MTDGDTSTAWRMRGDGAGETLTFRYGRPRAIVAVGLINGYAKTDPYSGEDRYQQERRITGVTWLLDGREVLQQLNSEDRSPQLLRLSAPITASTIQLHITGTLSGSPEHNYTAISEVLLEAG